MVTSFCPLFMVNLISYEGLGRKGFFNVFRRVRNKGKKVRPRRGQGRHLGRKKESYFCYLSRVVTPLIGAGPVEFDLLCWGSNDGRRRRRLGFDPSSGVQLPAGPRSGPRRLVIGHAFPWAFKEGSLSEACMEQLPRLFLARWGQQSSLMAACRGSSRAETGPEGFLG